MTLYLTLCGTILIILTAPWRVWRDACSFKSMSIDVGMDTVSHMAIIIVIMGPPTPLLCYKK